MKFLCICIAFLSSCATVPPANVNNVCSIFHQHPQWKRDAEDVAKRWKVPVPVQMAIIHQESKFDAYATPKRRKLLWVIPWSRPSSAYGYSQALHGTWNIYRHRYGYFWTTRDHFAPSVDFVGWYANEAYLRAGVARSDAYTLYLAYHEGVGGYTRKTYLQKPWLIGVARKVKARAEIYQTQLETC